MRVVADYDPESAATVGHDEVTDGEGVLGDRAARRVFDDAERESGARHAALIACQWTTCLVLDKKTRRMSIKNCRPKKASGGARAGQSVRV